MRISDTLPAFQEIVERHKEAADLVADIIVVDRDSVEALKEAEQARRVAAQSIEQGLRSKGKGQRLGA